MSTARQIIERAYISIGYKDPSEPLNGQDTNYALGVLNSMVDSWNTQQLYIWASDEAVATVTSSPVTVGTGQTVNITRPTNLLSGSFVRLNNVDYPITWISNQDYNAIPFKQVASNISFYGYYDRGEPIGRIFLYPLPSTSMELHIIYDNQFAQFTDLDTDVPLAQGYFNALFLTLAEQLNLGISEPSPTLVKQAWSARRAIKNTNAQIPMLNSGVELTGLVRFNAGL
jgi:hypothetical protein